VRPSIDLLVPSPRQATPTDNRLSLVGSIGVDARGDQEIVDRSRRRLRNLLPHPEAYRLEITNEAAEISADTGGGLFYGVSTLAQWIRLQATETGGPPRSLPGLLVDDAPAFAHRGVMLDASRNKVPKMATLLRLVDQLAGWKFNQLQLYIEHTFAYRDHGTVWRDASPFTPGEIRDLDLFRRDRYIELVPNQQSFGHMHRWLVHQPYRELAECPDGIDHPFSKSREPFSLCPTDPRSLELLADLYDELLPNFSSRMFNVGLDETLDLGRGRSAEACKAAGRHDVYLDFLSRVRDLAAERGRRIQFWADIVLQQPELIDRIPADAIALNWGYEADHPFSEETSALARTGLEFYVCPGTSSWNSFAGRADNALRNLKSCAIAGRDNGASGMLVTDWGDNGHLQPLPASYLGLLAGAALAWNADTDVHPSEPIWQELLDLWAFAAPASGLGRIGMALANTYLATGTSSKNGTPLFHLLMSPWDALDHGRYEGLSSRRLEAVLAAAAQAADDLDSIASDRLTDLAKRELRWIALAISLGARIGIERFAAGLSEPLDRLPAGVRSELRHSLDSLVDDVPGLWRERNRPGGLADSLARFADLSALLSV
jgi:hypothetical protein